MRATRIMANLRVADVEATKSLHADYLGLWASHTVDSVSCRRCRVAARTQMCRSAACVECRVTAVSISTEQVPGP